MFVVVVVVVVVNKTISAAARHAENVQIPARQRHDRGPVPSDSSEAYYLVPRPRLRGTASAQQRPYPSNSGIVTQPSFSGTVPQRSAPSHQQEVMRGLPSRNMGGK